MIRIGLISDTHGLLRPEAVDFLRGCANIIHGGDIGDPAILWDLDDLAPVTAVRGNNDFGRWAEALPEIAFLEIAGLPIAVIHDLAQLPATALAGGARVVISGHSHMPAAEERGGVLYANPGSAGPRRFRLPISVGELWISGGTPNIRLVTLA